jgi:hypothetical protein
MMTEGRKNIEKKEIGFLQGKTERKNIENKNNTNVDE